MLNTPQDVMNAVGVAALSADYYGLEPLTDGAGFAVRRRYPPDSAVAKLVNGRGLPCYTCVLQLSVSPPSAPGGVSRVWVSVFPYGECKHRFGAHDFKDPDCPTAETARRLTDTPKPLDLQFADEFTYDNGDAKFYNSLGPITGPEILEFVHNFHLRTLRRAFRLRHSFGSAVREATRRLVWRGQDACVWLLRSGYGVRVNEKKGQMSSIFHEYKLRDFERIADNTGTHFFGFQSSKASLGCNLTLLAIGTYGAYWLLPHAGFLRTIYNNTALSTAALILGFVIADQLAPLLLIIFVVGLSRLKPKTLFVVRRVQA